MIKGAQVFPRILKIISATELIVNEKFDKVLNPEGEIFKVSINTSRLLIYLFYFKKLILLIRLDLISIKPKCMILYILD
jgi:hypothetical protein